MKLLRLPSQWLNAALAIAILVFLTTCRETSVNNPLGPVEGLGHVLSIGDINSKVFTAMKPHIQRHVESNGSERAFGFHIAVVDGDHMAPAEIKSHKQIQDIHRAGGLIIVLEPSREHKKEGLVDLVEAWTDHDVAAYAVRSEFNKDEVVHTIIEGTLNSEIQIMGIGQGTALELPDSFQLNHLKFIDQLKEHVGKIHQQREKPYIGSFSSGKNRFLAALSTSEKITPRARVWKYDPKTDIWQIPTYNDPGKVYSLTGWADTEENKQKMHGPLQYPSFTRVTQITAMPELEIKNGSPAVSKLLVNIYNLNTMQPNENGNGPVYNRDKIVGWTEETDQSGLGCNIRGIAGYVDMFESGWFNAYFSQQLDVPANWAPYLVPGAGYSFFPQNADWTGSKTESSTISFGLSASVDKGGPSAGGSFNYSYSSSSTLMLKDWNVVHHSSMIPGKALGKWTTHTQLPMSWDQLTSEDWWKYGKAEAPYGALEVAGLNNNNIGTLNFPNSSTFEVDMSKENKSGSTIIITSDPRWANVHTVCSYARGAVYGGGTYATTFAIPEKDNSRVASINIVLNRPVEDWITRQ